ncbi:inositol 1,4,5-trisphosphate receptor-interacting protein-like 1 [Ambystoma mexicanum]|uniref:inositol 1,4,5-trisphosphate receptor-interacting protein-like 1 n=1 Tax=Ambystoma mexicanum TaxID=8296 RepID=UPI0037E9540B
MPQASMFFLAVILQLMQHSPLQSSKEDVRTGAQFWHHSQLLQEQMHKLQKEFECGSLEDQKEELWEAFWSRVKIKEAHETANLWSLSVFAGLCIVMYLWQCQQEDSIMNHIEDEDRANSLEIMTPLNMLDLNYPQRATLETFYKTQVQNGVHDMNQGFHFVEGFTHDLLEACRFISHEQSGLILKNGIGMGSAFEKWGWTKEPTFDVLVPICPPPGFAFRVESECRQNNPDKHACYIVALELGYTLRNVAPYCTHDQRSIIPCQRSHILEDLLCTNRSLNTQKVHKWFHDLVGRAWRLISCSYEFTLTAVYSTSCKLRLEFRSGHVLYINMIPSVRREDSLIFLVKQASYMGDVSDIHWSESFAIYERQFLKLIRGFVPENSCHLKCLSILANLKKSTMQGSQSFLSSYHFKTALMHLLIMLPPGAWHPERIAERMQDLLYYLGQSFSKKRLDHFTIGNPCLPLEISIPQEHRNVEPLNLLNPLLLEHRLCENALQEFNVLMSTVASLS